MTLLLALILAVGSAPKAGTAPNDGRALDSRATTPLRDDGYGVCPAFTHYHARDAKEPELDGKCHADSDDHAIESTAPDRRPLPSRQ